jgi:hypothetical protein
VVPVDALEPIATGEVPAALAAVGTGTSPEGEPVVVAVSPLSGGDAWLAAVAVTARLALEEGLAADAYAVSPSWPLAARRRLALLRSGALRLHARLEAAAAGDVAPEPIEAPLAAARALAADLREPSAHALWQRAAAALAGLAAKHGGAVRAGAGGLELVLFGKPVAALRAAGGGVGLEAFEPRRELMRLAPEGLSDTFDRLEGGLRKLLSDRRLREGEAGLRQALAARLVEAASLREAVAWPLAGALDDAIDFAGVDGEGRGVVGAARAELTLSALGPILDGWAALAPRLAGLLPDPTALRVGRAMLSIAAERFEPAAERVLACLDLELRAFAPEAGRREAPLVPRALAASPRATPLPAARPARPAAER